MSGEVTCTTLPCATGPITVTFDGTTSNDNPAIIGFICAEHAIYWTTKSVRAYVSCPKQPNIAILQVEAHSSSYIVFLRQNSFIYQMTERREAVLETLVATLGKEALNVIDYVDKDWSREPYNGGCPVYVMRPRTLLYYHHALKQQFGR